MTPGDVAEILRKHAELESAIASHNWLLGLFTAIVAIGIFAETIVEFIFSKEKPRKEVILTIVCSIVVFGGVIGEYIKGGEVADLAGQLQKLADKDVVSLFSEAAKANERAGNAME